MLLRGPTQVSQSVYVLEGAALTDAPDAEDEMGDLDEPPVRELLPGWRRLRNRISPPKKSSTASDRYVEAPSGSKGRRRWDSTCTLDRVSMRRLKANSASEKSQNVSRTIKPMNPTKLKVLVTTRKRSSISAIAPTAQSVQTSPQTAAGRI